MVLHSNLKAGKLPCFYSEIWVNGQFKLTYSMVNFSSNVCNHIIYIHPIITTYHNSLYFWCVILCHLRNLEAEEFSIINQSRVIAIQANWIINRSVAVATQVISIEENWIIYRLNKTKYHRLRKHGSWEGRTCSSQLSPLLSH